MGNPAENAEGPLVIGITINAVLLGVMTTQIYLYFTTFKHDPIWVKIFVAFLFLCDICNTGFDVAALYETLIRHFGDFEYLGEVTWHPALTGIIVTSTQLFFAWRIFALTKKKLLSLLIAILALVGGVSALLTAVKIQAAPMFELLFKVKVPIIVWLTAEVLGDIFITVSLVTYLVRSRNYALISKQRTGFQRTDLLIDRIIRVTIQTGMLTAIVATVDLFVYVFDPTGLHLAFNFPLCKLYSNSLMSALNSRGGWMQSESSKDEIKRSNDHKNLSVNTASTDGLRSYGGALPSPVKPAALFSDSTATQTEVYVNIESIELQDRRNALV